MIIDLGTAVGGTMPDRPTGIDHIGREELASAFQQEPGFSGALNLVNRESGQVILIVLWDTEERAEWAISLRGAGFRQALSRIAHISADTPSVVSWVWEVEIEL